MRVLLVCAAPGLCEFVVHVLREYGHEVVFGEDPAITWRMTRGEVDLLVFDLAEATPQRWEELDRWRRMSDLPLVVVGPSPDEEHVVRALRAGADDYVVRPLHAAEFVARLEALRRRATMLSPEDEISDLYHPSLSLDWRSYQACLDGRRVDLTPTEFRVLQALLTRRGEPVSRDDLAREIWGKERSAANTNLNLYIWHLRRKLEQNPARPRLIITRWGVGYVLQQEGSQSSDRSATR